MKTAPRISVALTLLLAAAAPLAAQDKPTLTPDDYDQWESLGGAVLSPDGDWMAVSIRRVDDSSELRIHRTDSDSVVVVACGSLYKIAELRGGGHLVAESLGGRKIPTDTTVFSTNSLGR